MKQYTLFFVVLIVSLVVFGCPIDDPNDSDDPDITDIEDLFEPPQPFLVNGEPLTGGPLTRTADGWASTPAYHYELEYGDKPGEPVSVTLTVTNGFISELLVDGPDETVGIGVGVGSAEPRLRTAIMDRNSFDVDVIIGATYTSDAIITAGKEALEAIRAGDVE